MNNRLHEWVPVLAAGLLLVSAFAVVHDPWLQSVLALGILVVVTMWIKRQYHRQQRKEFEKLASEIGDGCPNDPEDLSRWIHRNRQEWGARVQEAQRAQESLASLLDAAEAPLLAVRPDSRVFLCNAAAAALLGTEPSRLTGRLIQDAIPHPGLLAIHARAAQGHATREEIRLALEGGIRTVEVSASLLPDGGVILALRDVTEQARALQVKTDFVANASHELRTPITALRMAVETLAGEARDDPSMRERLLETIAGNTARLEEMVRDLLDLSRLESPEVTVRVIAAPGSEIRQELETAFAPMCARRNLTLAFEFDPDLETLWTDRRLLLLILRNLIENAAKFAYEGTTVRVTGRRQGGTARFEVIDRGIGIPLAHQERVFERYYQVDAARTLSRDRRGSGLGLAIVKHAVRRLGGNVRLSSIWKEGTTVSVEIPWATAPAKDRDPAASTETQRVEEASSSGPEPSHAPGVH